MGAAACAVIQELFDHLTPESLANEVIPRMARKPILLKNLAAAAEIKRQGREDVDTDGAVVLHMLLSRAIYFRNQGDERVLVAFAHELFPALPDLFLMWVTPGPAHRLVRNMWARLGLYVHVRKRFAEEIFFMSTNKVISLKHLDPEDLEMLLVDNLELLVDSERSIMKMWEQDFTLMIGRFGGIIQSFHQDVKQLIEYYIMEYV